MKTKITDIRGGGDWSTIGQVILELDFGGGRFSATINFCKSGLAAVNTAPSLVLDLPTQESLVMVARRALIDRLENPQR